MTQTKRDRKEKINNLTLHSEKCKLIYEWVKTGKISLQEYSELIQELKQQEQCKCGQPKVGGYSCQRTDCNQNL